MRLDDERDEARAQETRVLAALARLADEVRSALGEDLALFPTAEARRRFLGAPGFAAALDDGAIADIKAALETGTPGARDAVLAALADPAIWVSGLDVPAGEGRSFEDNPTLWAATRPIEALVAGVLARHGFPEAGDDPIRYRMPMRFIGRKYLPGLAEKYWSLIEDLRHARARLAELDSAEARDALARRWDKA
jgi:hypothetical protein